MKTNFNDEWNTEDFGLQHDINVTPFIDVVLVLLIVFMVAAPLATSSIPVQLPSITQAPTPQVDQPLFITVQKDDTLYIGDHFVNETNFIEILVQETKHNLETKILIQADTDVNYGSIVNVLNKLQTAGYTKVGFVGLQKAPHKTTDRNTHDKTENRGNDNGKNGSVERGDHSEGSTFHRGTDGATNTTTHPPTPVAPFSVDIPFSFP
ncbi:biopolymer transporter ExbD [Bartonella sp. F02]|uniref:biopolymer transporter ExbD n=1 Tax=Bartonella sp. F02 TaxID=2967262 RepID=UPI0022A91588|nr:biopolymer transporter ExbD [Bartonella sp. F02]MCZ2328844.1 biopolymer transporter ExbD [Bartonella sp. F02]